MLPNFNNFVASYILAKIFSIANITQFTPTRVNFGREKLTNLANHELFALPIFTDTLKMYLAYALTVAYSLNISSPIAFNCTYGSPKISSAKIVLCMVVHIQLYTQYCTYRLYNSRSDVIG